jgi:2-keto-4-pentenoate hydratase/2-oxohepta-3-ene-1,7-dioic acid hydratase in catechol pathway
MLLRTTTHGLLVRQSTGDPWVSLAAAAERHGSAADVEALGATDLLGFLAGDAELENRAGKVLAAAAGDAVVTVADPEAMLPLQPRSIRAFMVWDTHYTGSARMMVKRFFPKPVAAVASVFERTTGKTFPPLKPKKRFYEVPSFYMANHGAVLADGEPMWWPSHTKWLDFELELACVLARPIADATPEEAKAAIGGWFIMNDWSAREVQVDDQRHNPFGPVVKAKTFANTIGSDVLTASSMPDWRTATGRVRVDGEQWCEGTTAGAVHDIGDMLAYASAGERLHPGDVISTGTFPGCCGLELDRWITPGQTVELEIDGIGSLANTIDPNQRP